MDTQNAITRKRGPKATKAPTGYLRWQDAVERFKPLSHNAFHYRAYRGDIVFIEHEGSKAYEEASVIRVRDEILREAGAKKKETPLPQASSLEERVKLLEREVKQLRGEIAYLRLQLS